MSMPNTKITIGITVHLVNRIVGSGLHTGPELAIFAVVM
jgi:hypothetical protein